LHASEAVESPELAVPVRNERRRFVTVALPRRPGADRVSDDDIETLRQQLEMYESQFDAEIVEDVRYQLEDDSAAFEVPVVPEVPGADSLDEMLESLHADEVWSTTRGEGVVIAVVDTGINGGRRSSPSRSGAGSGRQPARTRGPTTRDMGRCVRASPPGRAPQAAS
jgi:subtilisin family serine protease